VPKKILTKRGKAFLSWFFNRIFKHVIGYVILVLILIVGYKYVENRWLKQEIRTSLTLKEGESRKAIINFRQKTLTTVRRDKEGKETQTVQNFSGLRMAVLTELEDGSVNVYAPVWGFVFEPGYTAFVANSRPRLGIDIQWFYWRRLGLSSGFGLGGRRYKDAVDGTGEARRSDLQLAGYPIAFNYNLPFKWTPNTNLFVGGTHDKQFTTGVTVKW